MKKKLVYISSEWFFDTDMSILKNLTKEYDLYWFEFTSFEKPRVHTSTFNTYAEENDITLELIDVKDKFLSPKRVSTFIGIANKINKIKPHLVVKVEQDAYWMVVSKFYIKCPIVYCIHDAEVHSGASNGWVRQLFTDATIKANRNFIVYSKSQKTLIESKYRNKNIALINMSVKNFGRSNVNRPSISNGIKLLFFGRIEYHKGLDLLIESLEKLYALGNNSITLSVLGRGSYWDKCELLVKDRSKYNLQIRFIKDDEIPDAFTSHHFLVLPYRDTTQSGPLMIAANYALPLFAFGHKSFREVYNDTSAIFFDTIDDGLTRLSSLSEEEYEQLTNSAETLKMEYSEQNITDKYIAYFNTIIG